MTKYSGFNMLTLGILYETVLRWVPPANRVFAYASKLIPTRIDPEKNQARHGRHPRQRPGPDDAGGRLGRRLPAQRRRLPRAGHVDRALRLRGDARLRPVPRRDPRRPARGVGLEPLPIPANLRGGWQVEADFIAAVRGERPVTHTPFADGVRYMQFTEAVARSSRHQQAVDLPLKEFSNPSL